MLLSSLDKFESQADLYEFEFCKPMTNISVIKI